MLYICILLILFAFVHRISKLSFISSELWLLVIGLFYGIAARNFNSPLLPVVYISPYLILHIILPLLIFAGSHSLSSKIFKTQAIPISFFAFFGVIATALLTAFFMYAFFNITLLHALVFGIAIGATDPAAVGAIFKNFTLPEKLIYIIEGESLFNDGTTIVLFNVILLSALGFLQFDIVKTSLQFMWVVFAAFPMGIVTGWLFAKTLTFTDENYSFFLAALSIAAIFITYFSAENLLHISGILSVLIMSLSFKRFLPKNTLKQDSEEQIFFNGFWQVINTFCNYALFFVLGAVTGSHKFDMTMIPLIIAASLMIIVIRAIVVYSGAQILRLMKINWPTFWQHVLFLGGVRGAISIALILLIPFNYKYRELFLCTACTLATLSLIIQPLWLKIYLQKNS